MPSTCTDNDRSAGRPGVVPVAICGMGMRLPGGIRDSDAFYDLFLNKRDARGPVPPDRFNLDGFYSSQGKPGSIVQRDGYWLEDIDLSHFDPSLFSMGRAEIENMDPHQRLMLEIVRETFENAAETNWRGKNIGCYAATFGEEWGNLHAKDVQQRGFTVYAGYMDLMQSNRISYEYDLRGPSMTLRVGCSGVGLGVHLAFQSIQLGECSSAIIVGSNLILTPETTMFMADGGTLSPDASSKAFDASANGYVRAEGINCVYVKRLDEAIRDGNPIRAVIRGTSTNADGKSSGLTVPSIDAQEALIRAAYRSGGLDDPSLTAMVECHGTGTALGDTIEATAVGRVFGEKGIYIGSVKPNLGHAEGASGLNSLIRAVVELEHRTILPNIKFNTPNPRIPWKESRLKVATEPTAWPEGRLERVSVSSYGIGGTNVHLVLDSAASFGLSSAGSIPDTTPAFKLLLMSAGHPDSLKEMQKNYQEYAEKHPERLTDLAYTLSHRREQLPVRGYCVTKGDEYDVVYSPPFTGQPQKKVAFIFTGQGAQWPQMGKDLLETSPEFLQDIREMDNVLQGLDTPPDWTLEEELLKPSDISLISVAEIAQPVSTAFQVALVNHLARWNILPSAAIGHSSGEIAAAYAAGALGMRDAIILAYFRGYSSKASTRPGSMAAVGLGYDDVLPWLKPGVMIACENSPASVTLSGDVEPLAAVLATLQKERPEVFQRALKVNKAYHSHHMQDVGRYYDELIGNRLSPPQKPRVPFFSSVTMGQMDVTEDFGKRYWRENMESPVWFNQGFSALLKSEVGQDAIILEVGPHSALAGPIKQIYRAHNVANPYLAVQTRGADAAVCFLSCVGELYARGVDMSCPLPSTKPRALHDLPLYPWHHKESLWTESRSMKASRFQKFAPDDLIGIRTIESSDIEPTWRNILRVGNVPWLRDHCVGPDIVFPGAAYIAMAGHAVYQMTGLKDFTVREVSFKTALVLDEMSPTEIITSLQPRRLTNSLNSEFFEFSVQSYDGSAWIQHCSGLVAGGQASPAPKPTVKSYSRVVDSKRWYRAMNKTGLRYGPRFTGLSQITASVSDNAASAVILDEQDPESSYPLHPSTIDFALQSAFVAMHRGQPRFMEQYGLPTFIEELYVNEVAAGQNIHVNTTAGKESSYSHGLAGDTLAFSLKGLEFTVPDRKSNQQEDQLETSQLVWKQHLEFVDPTTLIKPAQEAELSSTNPLVERIFLLCVIDAMEEIKDISPAPQPHLETYRKWMAKQLAQARTEGYPLVSDAKELFKLSASKRKELIKTLAASHTDGTMVAGSQILVRCYEHMVDIFKGKTDPLELMRREGLLSRYYDCLQDKHDYEGFLQLLGHLRPNMNVLEIGAGTGGLTAKILDYLRSESGEELYREYTYTDISSGFFVDAKKRFNDHPRIKYSVLDISKDPIEQGFTEGHYDMIIASNILHATPWLVESLKNCKTLLKPDGRLLLQELCPVSNWTNFIFGLFSGWWLGEEDGRVDEPYISPEEWDARLRDAGFAGVDASALDAQAPYQINSMLVARPTIPVFQPKKVTLLSLDASHAAVKSVQKSLASDGHEVDLVTWGEKLPADQDIVSLLDLEAPFFDGITEQKFKIFKETVKDHSTSNFLWVTQSAQIRPQDPRFAEALGMARTLRSELAIPFTTLEMENFGPGSAEAICLLLKKLQERTSDQSETSEFDLDQEFAWTNGAIHVGRLHWFSVTEALAHQENATSTAALEIDAPGLLDTLRWAPQPAKPLLPGEVRIKTMSVSMNFRDLLVAMGVVPNVQGQEVAGTDCAGVVTAIGSDVTNVSVGDRVMALSVINTCYTTELQLSSQFCARMPDDCSFDDASTFPTVYLTVLRTLREKANLRRGQTLLIHSAAGGLGIAAIHYAKHVGATIYATVSSPEKTKFLVETMGVAKENIFYSRDNSFVDAVMAATKGRGVDVLLNSLSGELLHSSWQCVAQGGSMIEIGKRDLLGHGQLALNPFLLNRSYIGVDLATLPLIAPEWVQENLELVADLYKQGAVKPIRPITPFPADKVEDAFRQLQKGQHIGKFVLQFAEAQELPVAPKVPELELRADKTYLLVGGMRGIGAALARWMASQGAKHMAFLSRSAGQRDEDKALVRELSDMGCETLTFAGDVADMATVQRVVSSVKKPIAGVLQLAMVLADAGVMDMSTEKWNAAVKPKVDGAWNLHKALPKDMDFFVMTGSMVGMFGHHGQSNYAAANTFLDAFAQFRQSQGLAAATVDLGAVDEIGFLTQSASVHRQMVQQWSCAISEQSLLNCFHLAMVRSRPSNDASQEPKSLEGFRARGQLVHGLLSKAGSDKKNYIWKRDVRTALSRVHQEKGGSAGGGDSSKDGGLKGFLSAVQDNPDILREESTAEVVAKEIARQVSIYTMRGGDQEVDLSVSLKGFGVDSLVSIEIRNWWKQAFGADVTVLQLMSSASFLALGEKAVEQLKQKHLKEA